VLGNIRSGGWSFASVLIAVSISFIMSTYFKSAFLGVAGLFIFKKL